MLVLERAQGMAEAGFGVPPRMEGDGFFSYPVIDGQPATAPSVTTAVLDRIAAYCAFRSSAFSCEAAGQPELERMMAWNYFKEFGEELPTAQRVLPLVRPVVPDGRMQPHEWIAGTWLLKTDGAGHGNVGYCKMAAEAMRGSDEAERVQGAYLNYRELARQLTRQAAAA